jgi:amino acid transporter
MEVSAPPSAPRPRPPGLARGLGTGDAVVIGLGSMIGAGVFAVFGPAAQTTGALLLVGLVVAAVVAYCNAVASAQLAAAYPTSGGTYIYGRQCLGRWWGFTAGWGFVVDKIASAAAMVLALASYAVPEPGWGQRLTAVGLLFSLSAATPGSPPWTRKFATRPAPSRALSRSRWRSPGPRCPCPAWQGGGSSCAAARTTNTATPTRCLPTQTPHERAPNSIEPAAAPQRQELILGRPGQCVQRRGDKRTWVRRPG